MFWSLWPVKRNISAIQQLWTRLRHEYSLWNTKGSAIFRLKTAELCHFQWFGKNSKMPQNALVPQSGLWPSHSTTDVRANARQWFSQTQGVRNTQLPCAKCEIPTYATPTRSNVLLTAVSILHCCPRKSTIWPLFRWFWRPFRCQIASPSQVQSLEPQRWRHSRSKPLTYAIFCGLNKNSKMPENALVLQSGLSRCQSMIDVRANARQAFSQTQGVRNTQWTCQNCEIPTYTIPTRSNVLLTAESFLHWLSWKSSISPLFRWFRHLSWPV